MNQLQLKSVVRGIDVNMTCRARDGEFRISINPSYIMRETGRTYASACDRAERMAYYTNCAEDAALTAKHIWADFARSCGKVA